MISKELLKAISFLRHIQNCLSREYGLLIAGKTGHYTKFFLIVSVGLAGAVSREGVLVMSILYLSWL